MQKEVVFDRTDLSSRALAAIEREYISDAIKADENIIVNMGKVLCITDGYADELFGILVRWYGLDRVAEKVQLIGSEYVLEQVSTAMVSRMHEKQNKEKDNGQQKPGRTDGGKQLSISGL